MLKRKYMFILIIFLFLFNNNLSYSDNCSQRGYLIAIGGGKRPEIALEKFIQLSGGNDSKIVIIPNASEEPKETCETILNELGELGCTNMTVLNFDNKEASDPNIIEILNNADGLYFTGGDQEKLMRSLKDSKAIEIIRRKFNSGMTVCGTSAGSAVMSDIMITGTDNFTDIESEMFASIKKNMVETDKGIGFINNVVIDQHFIKRKRFNRLISLILEKPFLKGLGIDENTAVIIDKYNNVSVVGDGTITLIDCGKCIGITTDKNNNLKAENIKINIYSGGDKFKLY